MKARKLLEVITPIVPNEKVTDDNAIYLNPLDIINVDKVGSKDREKVVLLWKSNAEWITVSLDKFNGDISTYKNQKRGLRVINTWGFDGFNAVFKGTYNTGIRK